MEEGGEAPSPRILLLMYRPGDRLAYGELLSIPVDQDLLDGFWLGRFGPTWAKIES
jgi:hypothetical protein